MSRPPAVAGSVRLVDGVAHVMLAGELDLDSAPAAGRLLSDAVTSGAPSVAVDLALVSFCDAVGLGLLVRARNELALQGGQLSLTGVPEALRRLLTVTGLSGALHTAPETTADALLAAELEAAVRLPLVRNVLDAALGLVVVMSAAVLAGADGVSITLPRDGRLRTVAASDKTVLEMDHDQYDTGQGPCLDAAQQGELFSSAALADEARWPQFVPRARARGIESIMSTPLMAADRPLGALNVYSRAAGALADHEQQWADGFAQQASAVLMAASGLTADAVATDIGLALDSRQVIAQAQGVVMAQHRMLPEDAFRFLTEMSRRTSVPLATVCADVVSSTAPSSAAGTEAAARRDGGQ